MGVDMTSVQMPTTKELKDALLEVLRESPEGLTTSQIDTQVAKKLQLSAEQLGVIRTGNRTEVSYRLAWERTHAKKKGLIEKTAVRTWRIINI
jgi:restriction endonuclease Mrr